MIKVVIFLEKNYFLMCIFVKENRYCRVIWDLTLLCLFQKKEQCTNIKIHGSKNQIDFKKQWATYKSQFLHLMLHTCRNSML